MITIQATGHEPLDIEPLLSATATEKVGGDKRQVRVTYHKTEFGELVVMEYLTGWETEHNFCWVLHRRAAAPIFNSIWDGARTQAKSMLPPGAGYPAMPAFETRQAKLIGMLETATLVAISRVLARLKEISDDPKHQHPGDEQPGP